MIRFDKFNEQAQESAQQAAEIMQRYGHNQIDTEHWMLALIEQSGGIVSLILEKLNISPDAIRERLDAALLASPKNSIFGGGAGQIFITPRVKRIIDIADKEATGLKDDFIASEHIFLAILTERNTPVARILNTVGLQHDQVYDAIHDLREQNTKEVSPMRFDRFTEQAQEIAQRAAVIIERYDHNQIDIEHILLAILETPYEGIPDILENLNINSKTLCERLDEILRTSPKKNIINSKKGQIFITPRVKKIIDISNDEANHLKDEYISTEHIFLAILTERNTPAARILGNVLLNHDRVLDTIINIRNSPPRFELDQFSSQTRETIQHCNELLLHYGHRQVDLEHLLLAIIEGTSSVPKIVKKLTINIYDLIDKLHDLLLAIPKSGIPLQISVGEIPITYKLKKVIHDANEIRYRFKDVLISDEHLFLVFLRGDSDRLATQILINQGLTYNLTYPIIRDMHKEGKIDKHQIEKTIHAEQIS